jgi:hypothetical protein
MLHAEQRAEHIGVKRRRVALGGLLDHWAGLTFGSGSIYSHIQTTKTRSSVIY